MFNIESTRKKSQPRKHYGFRLMVQNAKREDGTLKFVCEGIFPTKDAALDYGKAHFPKHKVRTEGVRADIRYSYIPINTKV